MAEAFGSGIMLQHTKIAIKGLIIKARP